MSQRTVPTGRTGNRRTVPTGRTGNRRTGPTGRTGTRRRSLLGQAGYTLMELLLVIAITGIIFVPLMAWAGLAIRQQPVLQDGMLRTASAGLLGSYLPRDVKIAGKAAVNGNGFDQTWASADCVGGAGANGSMQLVLITGGAVIEKVVYSTARSSDDPHQQSVWRRACTPATGALISSQEVYRDVRGGLTRTTCSSESGDTPCRQVEMTVTPRTTSQTVTVRATRRLDEGSVPTDLYGNPTPSAEIDILSRSGSTPLTATFSAQGSTVAAGRVIASYLWEFQGPGSVAVTGGSTTSQNVQASFSTPGSYTILLTVTDELGFSGTSYTQIATSNDAPSAIASASPSAGDVGSVFTLDGRASFDPDGAIAAFDWIVDYPSADGITPGVRDTLSGATASLTPAAGITGLVGVMLIVTDTQGAQGVGFASFQVTDPSIPTTTLGPGSTQPPIDPSDPSSLVAVFTDSAAGGATVTLDASSSTGIGVGNTATYTWILGDGATATDATLSHTYPNAGGYPVRVTVSTSDGRVATVARLIAVGGAPPAPINVRHDGTNLLWDAVPGARRYLADFEYRTLNDCLQQIANQAVAAGPDPSKAIPLNPCPASATAKARVGTDSNGTVTWSDWINIPTLNAANAPTPTPTPPAVVK